MIAMDSKEINKYCEIHSQQDSAILQELIAFTYDHEAAPQMISGLQVGNLLQAIIMKKLKASNLNKNNRKILMDALLITISGLSAAMKNTG